MTDAEIITWLNEHASAFRQTLCSDENRAFELRWIDDEGYELIDEGKDIRDCVIKANKKN
jgi:hypothetical protein